MVYIIFCGCRLKDHLQCETRNPLSFIERCRNIKMRFPLDSCPGETQAIIDFKCLRVLFSGEGSGRGCRR